MFGAVHRSPDVPLSPDGLPHNRLLLKVDWDVEELCFLSWKWRRRVREISCGVIGTAWISLTFG